MIVLLLQAFFYVTEHSDYRNHVFYYRKAVWSRVVNRALRGTPEPWNECSSMGTKTLRLWDRSGHKTI